MTIASRRRVVTEVEDGVLTSPHLTARERDALTAVLLRVWGGTPTPPRG